MNIWKYTFCTEFNWGHILAFLWWYHYCAVISLLPSSFLLQLTSVEQHWVKRDSEQVQQANVFKRQKLTFQFSTYPSNSCNIYPITRRFDRTRESTARYIDRQNNTATILFLINTFSTMNKLSTPNMYCW